MNHITGTLQYAQSASCNSTAAILHKPSVGPRCNICRATEARCALLAGCCDDCTHKFGAPAKRGPKPRDAA